MKIKSYFKDDENVLLLNVQYVHPTKQDNGTWTDGVLYLIYRDLKTRKKHVRTVVNPEVETFITKPEYRNTFSTQRKFLPVSNVDSYVVPYTQLTRFIQKQLREDGTDIEYLKICETAPKEIFKWRHTYFSDYDIRDYAMMAYLIQQNERIKDGGEELDTTVSSAYLDIESDIYGLTTSEMDDGCAPINAVSVVLGYDVDGTKLKHPIVCTFLLENTERYKDQQYFIDHLEKFKQECHDEFDKKYNEPEFRIFIFKNEIKMLKKLFQILHTAAPDFIQIWN